MKDNKKVVANKNKKGKVTSKIKKKLNKDLIFDTSKYERIFVIIVAIIFVILLVACFSVNELIPATLIALSLEIFSFCYYIKDIKSKKVIYSLFTSGVIVLVISVVYTIMHTI